MTTESVFRVVKSQDYVTISNYHLRDKRLKMAAKGLMSVLLTDEGDAAYTMAELTELGPEGKDAIRSALKQLETCGYIQKRQLHDGAGRFASNEFLVYEIPPLTENPKTVEPSAEKPLTENPPTDKPPTGKPFTENPKTVAPEPELELNHSLSTTPEVSNPRKRENKEEIIINPPAGPLKSLPKWKPERFAAFWEFYRKHCRGESRMKAVKAWDKLKPDDALIDEIGRALQRQLKSEEWQRGIGIPYAATYLSQRRWEDDIGPRPMASPAPDMPSGGIYWTEDMEL